MRGIFSAALLTLLGLAACVPEGLAFRIDERVKITQPADRETVALPVRIAWEVDNFDVVAPGAPAREDAGYFGVYVDRAALPPGQHIPKKPGTGVYTTSDTELVLKKLPPDTADREEHTATVILLDGAGRRIGESAFNVTFAVENA